MKIIFAILMTFVIFNTSFAQSAVDFRQRVMTRTPIHFSMGDGSIQTAEYWQLALGRFEVDVIRRFPGEGDVSVNGNVNVSFMSGGYLEGSGFGARGRMGTTAEFAVRRDGELQIVRPDAIEFIFFGGTRVQLVGESEPRDLYIFIENNDNIYTARNFTLAIFRLNRSTRELEFSHDIDAITSLAFTAANARRGHAATVEEASRF